VNKNVGLTCLVTYRSYCTREILENKKNVNLYDDVHWTAQAIDEVEQETLIKSWRNYLEKKERQIENKLTEEAI
jgi:hypothetical protein